MNDTKSRHAHVIAHLDIQQSPPVISHVGIYSSAQLTNDCGTVTFEVFGMVGASYEEAVTEALRAILRFPEIHGWTIPFLTERHGEEIEELTRILKGRPIQ